MTSRWPHWLKIYGLSGVDFLIYRCNENVKKYPQVVRILVRAFAKQC